MTLSNIFRKDLLAKLTFRDAKEKDRGKFKLSHSLFTINPLLQALNVYVFHGPSTFARAYKFIIILIFFSKTYSA